MAAVDQRRIRRSRTGLIAHDSDRAFQGYTLFTPMFGEGTVYLLDMQGEVVHTWRLPHRPGLYGYLLDDGHLFYSGKVMDDLERFEAWPRFKAGAALEVDWSGRVLWEVRHPDHHHDARAGCATGTSCCSVSVSSPTPCARGSGAVSPAARRPPASTATTWWR